MTIILDENVPWPLRQFFAGHEVTPGQLEGWTGVQNGELISRIDGRFDVLILADKNLRYQQKLTGRKIALVELPTNRWLGRAFSTASTIRSAIMRMIKPALTSSVDG